MSSAVNENHRSHSTANAIAKKQHGTDPLSRYQNEIRCVRDFLGEMLVRIKGKRAGISGENLHITIQV